MSEAEATLALHLRANGIKADREYRFAAEACGGTGRGLRGRLDAAGLRDWRADFAILGHRLLVEVEGGGWIGGRHSRGKGFAEDLLKYEAALRLGWTVYRCDPEMIRSGRAIETVLMFLGRKAA